MANTLLLDELFLLYAAKKAEIIYTSYIKRFGFSKALFRKKAEKLRKMGLLHRFDFLFEGNKRKYIFYKTLFDKFEIPINDKVSAIVELLDDKVVITFKTAYPIKKSEALELARQLIA